jgi:hypothetical protein
MSWSDRELSLLGQHPDREVARRLRRSINAVSLKRQKLGIPACEQPRWTKTEIALLGTVSDREIARRLGRSLFAVQTKRLKLGIVARLKSSKRKPRPLDANKVRLHFGPYSVPEPSRGGYLFCRIRGKVKVGSYSNGPIPWPCVEGTRSPILCDDLVLAVERESELAVAHHWGVSPTTVSKWRRVLEVDPVNSGTRILKSYTTTEAMTPALRAHIAARKRGKPRHLSPTGERRLLAALRRPKPESWRKVMAPHWAARRGRPVDPADKPWSAKEERVLGTMPDREAARLIGRAVGAVMSHRRLKQIPYRNPQNRPWTGTELKLLGRSPDAEIARQTGHSLQSVQGKRLKLGIRIRPASRSWSRREDRMLGTRPDTELARKLNRFRTDVRARRLALGIAACRARPDYREWSAKEDALFGTAADSQIARRLKRSRISVQLRRRRLGIQSARVRRLAKMARKGSQFP